MNNIINFSENAHALEKQQEFEWKLNAPFVQEEITKWVIDGTDVYSPEGRYVNNFASAQEAELFVQRRAIGAFIWEQTI